MVARLFGDRDAAVARDSDRIAVVGELDGRGGLVGMGIDAGDEALESIGVDDGGEWLEVERGPAGRIGHGVDDGFADLLDSAGVGGWCYPGDSLVHILIWLPKYINTSQKIRLFPR